MVTPYLTFWGTAKLFSKVATPFAVLPKMYIGLCWWLSSAGDSNARDSSSIPRLGRSPGEGNGNPLQYSCPGRGAWQATVVHGVVRVGHDSIALPQQCMNVLIFLHPHQHLSFIIWFFFFFAFLFNFSHFSGFEVTSPYSSDLHFPITHIKHCIMCLWLLSAFTFFQDTFCHTEVLNSNVVLI